MIDDDISILRAIENLSSDKGGSVHSTYEIEKATGLVTVQYAIV
jgi:hypothetical protein